MIENITKNVHLTFFHRVVTVAVGVVRHLSEQGVMGMRVFCAQAVCVCCGVSTAPPREFTYKQVIEMMLL